MIRHDEPTVPDDALERPLPALDRGRVVLSPLGVRVVARRAMRYCLLGVALFGCVRHAAADEVCERAAAPVLHRKELPVKKDAPSEPKVLATAVVPAPASDVVVVPLPPPPAEQDAPRRFDDWQRPVGLVMGGAGVVGLGVAGAFTLDMLTKRADSKPCTGSCKPRDQSDDDARASGKIAAVAAVTGFTLAAAGGVLYLTAPAPPVVRDLRFSPTFASGGGGISAKATF
jgi:hypothetical protein